MLHPKHCSASKAQAQDFLVLRDKGGTGPQDRSTVIRLYRGLSTQMLWPDKQAFRKDPEKNHQRSIVLNHDIANAKVIIETLTGLYLKFDHEDDGGVVYRLTEPHEGFGNELSVVRVGKGDVIKVLGSNKPTLDLYRGGKTICWPNGMSGVAVSTDCGLEAFVGGLLGCGFRERAHSDFNKELTVLGVGQQNITRLPPLPKPKSA